jgi:quinolinate synthase
VGGVVLFGTPQLPEAYRALDHTEMEQRVRQIKVELGDRLVILGHHYQKDEVFQFADFSGDSLKLARQAADQNTAEYIVFCGVHFMAETADILTTDKQAVLLPDLKAGCSMADMASMEQLEECWETLQPILGDTLLPMTYVNSTADIKAFCGKNGGLTCTSSNASSMFEWAWQQRRRILFLPDEYLGRNTGVAMGVPRNQMAVYNPHTRQLEGVTGSVEDLRLILWKGFCSVHQQFRPEHVRQIRHNAPDMSVLVHPECHHDVVQLADDNGSTEYIIRQVQNAPAGSAWAIGTEVNLVQRLAKQHPEQRIRLLSDMLCPCLTMNRIDLPHLLWALETCLQGNPVNRIVVSEEIARDARTALNRMLALS